MQLQADVPAQFRGQAKGAAVAMMVIGALSILLPFYFAVFSVMILGIAVLCSGLLGVLYFKQLRNQGVTVTGAMIPWLFVLLGALLLFLPQLTLSVAGFIIGGGMIFSGVMGWLAERRVINGSLWYKLTHIVTAVLGLVLVLSGASGAAWLIGVMFGINMLIAGGNLWINVTALSRQS